MKPKHFETSEESEYQDNIMVCHNTHQTPISILVCGCDDDKPNRTMFIWFSFNSGTCPWFSSVLEAVKTYRWYCNVAQTVYFTNINFSHQYWCLSNQRLRQANAQNLFQCLKLYLYLPNFWQPHGQQLTIPMQYQIRRTFKEWPFDSLCHAISIDCPS